ncbi:MAG: amidohydrolase [Steroidobacteraceae bacterium]
MSRVWLCALALITPWAAVPAAAPPAPDTGWLMVVRTIATNPAREAEFNDWYDRIDIPDVLEVPGYMRARRGLGQPLPELPDYDLQDVAGKYVALYDIRSPDIDRTIIDMLMASQQMVARGRSTSALKVVGRFYYQQAAAAYDAPAPAPAPTPAAAGTDRYLVLLTAGCCGDAAREQRFARWYEKTYVPALLHAGGVQRLTRYRLYRVLMFDPVEMPPFLAVAEVQAATPAEAARRVRDATAAAVAEGRANGLYVEKGATVYRQIADVPRPASSGAAPQARAPAALVLRNGRVHTPGGVAEALAVDRAGLITAVGTNADIEPLRGAGTRVIELAGHAVLPGLADMHVHPIFAGLQARRCVIAQGSTLAQVQQSVRACVARAAPGAWITGGQWDAPALGGIPDRAMLDAVAPGNPVFLGDTSEHSGWANSKALALAGITRRTPDPESGIIERDARGEPTGIVREDAMLLVRRQVPEESDAEVRAALRASLDEMLSYGITSFTEASAGYSTNLGKELRAYVALADAGVLRQRARLCLGWDGRSASDDALIAGHNAYARERLAPDCVKLFLDGVPTDSHTAAMLEPYVGTVAGRDDAASRRGLLLMPQAAIDSAVTRFDRMGLTVKFHAAGDAAVRAGLDGIAAARRANGYSGRLHDVGHCTFVAASDLGRARAIGATFEVSPYLWGPSPINDAIAAAVGPELIARVWPVREMLDAGALVVPGSDWSVVPSVNPWNAVETLVTREEPGGSARSFGKREAITREEALDLFTVNAARHLGQEGRLGRIAPGMLADLIVLDQDPYEVPVTRIHATRVLDTIINGEVVYQRAP